MFFLLRSIFVYQLPTPHINTLLYKFIDRVRRKGRCGDMILFRSRSEFLSVCSLPVQSFILPSFKSQFH